MIKDILKMGGCKTEKEFLKKYPTEESFLEAFPQARPMLESYMKGGDTEAFPQQPTESQFFDYSYPTMNIPRLFQTGGVAFPQAPSADKFFSYTPATPNLPRLFQTGGVSTPPPMGDQEEESPLLVVMKQMVGQYNIDPGQMISILNTLPKETVLDLDSIASEDPEYAAQALMEIYNSNRNQPLMEKGGPMIEGQGTMMPQLGSMNNTTDEYGGSVFNYGQRPAIMEKGGSVGMNKQDSFLQNKLDKFIGKLNENAVKGKLEDAENDMAAYYGYKKGGSKNLKKFQYMNSQMLREDLNMDEDINQTNPENINQQNKVAMANQTLQSGYPGFVPNERDYAGTGQEPGAGILSQDVINRIRSGKTPEGKPYSGPPMANPPQQTPKEDKSGIRALPGMGDIFDKLQGKEYNFTDDVNRYNEEKDKKEPSINAPGDEITKTYDVDGKKSRLRKYRDDLKGRYKSMSKEQKKMMLLQSMNALTSAKQKQIDRERENQLANKLFNPANLGSPYPTNMGKWDVNTSYIDPTAISYATGTGMAYGGQLPQAQSGLEVKMRAGLGFNANQLSWPVMAGEFSEPDFAVGGTLGAIPREDATLEAEHGETTMTDLAGIGIPQLYDIGGKKHSKGGTPLDLPDNSFVFSEFMKLKDKEQLAMFGINNTKRGGVSFADISKKFKLNDHIKKLMDPNSDELTRDTAQMNIVNANMKLGKLALLQESTKNFPDGIPMISMPYLESVGISPDQLAGAMPNASGPTNMGEEEEPNADNMARFGANVIGKMMTKKTGGTQLPMHQQKGPVVTKKMTKEEEFKKRWPFQTDYNPNDATDMYGLNDTDFGNPKSPWYGLGQGFVNFMEQTGDIDKFFSPKNIEGKTVFAFNDPSTGKMSPNFDKDGNNWLSQAERTEMWNTYKTSAQQAMLPYDQDIEGVSWRSGLSDEWDPYRVSGGNNQELLYNMHDAMENRMGESERQFKIYNGVKNNQSNLAQAKTALEGTIKLRDEHLKNGQVGIRSASYLLALNEKIDGLTKYVNTVKEYTPGGKYYGQIYYNPQDNTSGIYMGPNVGGNTTGTTLTYEFPTWQEDLKDIEKKVKEYQPPASGTAADNKKNTVTTTPAPKQSQEEFMAQNQQSINDWATMIKNNRKTIDDVPSELKSYVKDVLDNKAPVVSTTPAPAAADTTNKVTTTPVVKDNTKKQGTRQNTNQGTQSTSYQRTAEQEAYVDSVKKAQQNVQMKRLGGSLGKFMRKYQGGGPFDIFEPKAQVNDLKGYTEVRAKDTQGNLFDPKRFGTQKYDANLGYYTVYDKTSGKYVPLNLDDFYKRQSELIEGKITGTKYKTGINDFKADLLSKDKATREAATGWFQTEYNKLRNDTLKMNPYFGDWAQGQDPYGIDKKFGVFTFSAPGYFKDGTPPPKENPSDCECTDPDGVKRKREKIKGPDGTMICPPCVEPEIQKNKEDLKQKLNEPARFWTEDIVNTGAAFMNLGDVKKYLPWQAVSPFYAAQPTFESPERAVAAVNEALSQGAEGAAAFGSPQGYAAAFSSMAGDASQNTANILADVNNRNINVANQFELQNKAAYNQYMQQQAANATNMYDKWTIANQQYDNAKREARDELRNQFTNAWKNRGMTQTMNAMYSDQYYTDPRTGYTTLVNPKEFDYTEPTYDNMPDYLKKIYDQAMAEGNTAVALDAYEAWKEIVNKRQKADTRQSYITNMRNIKGVTDTDQ